MAVTTDNHKGQALVYCRVSTRKQEDEGTSLDSQEAACVKHATELGYAIGHVTREVYSGAELWDRPLLSRDREGIKAKAFGALVVYATDRLSRDPIHLAIIADECERAGVELVFVTEPLDNTDEGRLIQYVKGYAAKLEREKIRERQLRGKQARLLSGKIHNSGAEMYGYRRDKAAGKRLVYEPEARVVRQMFEWVAASTPIREVIRRLNERGVPPPSVGKYAYQDGTPRWAHGTVSRYLREPSYRGEAIAWRRHRAAKGSNTMQPGGEQIRLPDGTVPAIVDPSLWEAVQKKLDTNKGESTRNAARPYLLRGLVYCGVCGRKMRASPQKTLRVYRCSSRETPDGRCGCKQVPADDFVSRDGQPRDDKGHFLPIGPELRADLPTQQGLDSWVWEKVSAVLRNPSLIAAELERRRGEGAHSALDTDRTTAKASIARAQKQQERLIRRFSDAADDSFPWELVEREIARLERERQEWAATLEEIDRRIDQQRTAVAQLDALQEYCEAVAQNLDSFGFEEKRLALEALGIRVTANGREWQLQGSVPVDTAGGVSSRPW